MKSFLITTIECFPFSFLPSGDLFDMLLPMLSIYNEYVRNHHYSLQVLAECKTESSSESTLKTVWSKACMWRQVYGNIPHLPNAPGECEICTNWVIFVKECINWVILGVIVYEGHVYGNIPHLPNAPGECEICTNWVIFVKEWINWVI